ncbi:hypothetical protein KY284_013454 [Solanum tuberosum]|nr:hypothetical protein KY284_013454 [Solanum tuberosum]
MVQTSNGMGTQVEGSQMQRSQRSGTEQHNQYYQSGASKGDEYAPYFTPNQYNQILQMLNK